MYIIATSFALGHLIVPLMFLTCDFAGRLPRPKIVAIMSMIV